MSIKCLLNANFANSRISQILDNTRTYQSLECNFFIQLDRKIWSPIHLFPIPLDTQLDMKCARGVMSALHIWLMSALHIWSDIQSDRKYMDWISHGIGKLHFQAILGTLMLGRCFHKHSLLGYLWEEPVFMFLSWNRSMLTCLVECLQNALNHSQNRGKRCDCAKSALFISLADYISPKLNTIA